MSRPMAPPFPQLIPDSAPFTPEQRTWLNGFVAGLVSLDGGAITPLSPDQSAALMPSAAPASPSDDDDAPWHDQTLPLPERMTLAEGRPLQRRMMAAMAQQDCGQCGYSCHDSSTAVFSRTEERLNLCAPGGKETARILKTLYQELDNSPPTPASAKTPAIAAAPVVPSVVPGCSRDHPAGALFLSRTRLNKVGSAKEIWHLEFDLTESGIEYTVGDAFGLFPTNDPALADAVLAALDAPVDFPI